MSTFVKVTMMLVFIVAAGIVLMVVTMVPDAAHASSNCYDALNAAGQVVETICH